MKPEVLSLGDFPDATMAELHRRFALHHFFDFALPPAGLQPEVASRIRAIATRAAALRMRVLYHGPRQKPDVPYAYVPSLIELARQSDYLMVACKGGPATRHLVSAEVMAALGPNGTLINVARGSVVDEA